MRTRDLLAGSLTGIYLDFWPFDNEDQYEMWKSLTRTHNKTFGNATGYAHALLKVEDY